MCPLLTVVIPSSTKKRRSSSQPELLRELARCSFCLPGSGIVAIGTTKPRRECSESSPLGTPSYGSVGLNGGLAGLIGVFLLGLLEG